MRLIKLKTQRTQPIKTVNFKIRGNGEMVYMRISVGCMKDVKIKFKIKPRLKLEKSFVDHKSKETLKTN